MNSFKTKFKNIFKTKEIKPKYKIGDVVWANMPEYTISENTPESHKIRPYVIAGYDSKNNEYQTFYCTSNNRYMKDKMPVVLNNKVSNIKLYECIKLKENEIVNFMCNLKENTQKKLVKKLVIKCQEASELEIVNKYKDNIFVEVGDVILLNNSFYYVYALENNKYHLLNVRNNINKKEKNKYINRLNYFIDLDETTLVDLKVPCIILESFDSKDTFDIDISRKKYKKSKKYKEKSKQKNNITKTENNNINVEVNNNLDTQLSFGDILKFNDESLIYMYTDKTTNLHYLINKDKLRNHPLSFCDTKSINLPFKKIGSLSNKDTLNIITMIKPLLPFFSSNRIANEIKEICLKEENDKIKVRG